MLGRLLKKHRVHQRLTSHLLSENINRIKIFALIPVLGVALLLVNPRGLPVNNGYPPWVSIVFGVCFLLLSAALQIANTHIRPFGQSIILNATHLAFLGFAVSLYFCRGEFQEYSLTLFSIGILFCALTIVRQPIIMIVGYLTALAALLGYSAISRRVLPSATDLFLVLLVIVIACTSAAVRFKRSLVVFNEQEQIERLNRQLEVISATDKLTGLANRMKTDEELHRLIQWAKDYGRPLSVILFDVDNFKQINDSYGHQTGDRVVQIIAQTVRANTRQEDFIGRWGGDEFLVICPQMELRQSTALAERIRDAVSAAPLPNGIRVTISGGVGEISGGETESCLFSRVDEALYNAKTRGRNRLEVSAADCA